MIPFAHIRLGEGAGPVCLRCARTAPVPGFRSGTDVTAEIREVAETWTAPVGPNLLLDGFEPFSHPELPALISAAANAGVARIGLETDGGALAQGVNAPGAFRSGVRHLRVRTLGIGRVADDLAGRPGLSASLLAGVQAFLDAASVAGEKVAVAAVIPVCPHNLDMLPSTVAALADAGVQSISLVGNGEVGPPAAVVIAAACDTGTVNRVWVDVMDLPLPNEYRDHAAEALQ
ncbi:MAG: hypothetical protein ACYC77_01075 [Coriobacteriia bacterium]